MGWFMHVIYVMKGIRVRRDEGVKEGKVNPCILYGQDTKYIDVNICIVVLRKFVR